MMLKQIAVGVGVLTLVCMPYTFFPENPDWFRLDASWAAPGHSGDGGNNGNHTGMGGGGSNGQGGGDGGQGGSHGGGGGNGGNGGGNNGGGDGGNSGGGSASGASVGAGGASVGGSVGAADGPGGATGIAGNTGVAGLGNREHLVLVIRMCEMTRPGLAIGDTDGNGGWSFRTFDDTVWPFVQRCMADHGYPAYGTDFHNTTNFGSR